MGKFNVQFDSLNYMKADFTNYKMLLEKNKKKRENNKNRIESCSFYFSRIKTAIFHSSYVIEPK